MRAKERYPKYNTYIRLRTRLIKSNKIPDTDTNGYYLPIDELKTYLQNPYRQEYQGRVINHTIRPKLIQKRIDLEKTRFNALLERCTLSPHEIITENIEPDVGRLLLDRYDLEQYEIKKYIKKHTPTWKELFCTLYHLSYDDITNTYWDYDMWRKHYDCVPNILLDENFEFDFYNLPGTNDFYPEFAYKAIERKEIKQQEEIEKRLKKSRQYILNMNKNLKNKGD